MSHTHAVTLLLAAGSLCMLVAALLLAWEERKRGGPTGPPCDRCQGQGYTRSNYGRKIKCTWCRGRGVQ